MLRGRTQQELGDAVGVGKSAVSKWENGKIPPPLDRLEQVADMLEVRLIVMLQEEPDPDADVRNLSSAQTDALDELLRVLPRLDDHEAAALATMARTLGRRTRGDAE